MRTYTTTAARDWVARMRGGKQVYTSLGEIDDLSTPHALYRVEGGVCTNHALYRVEIDAGILGEIQKLKTDDKGEAALEFLNRYGSWGHPELEISVGDWQAAVIDLQRALWLWNSLKDQSEALKDRAVLKGRLIGYRWPPRYTKTLEIVRTSGEVISGPLWEDWLDSLEKLHTTFGGIEGAALDQYVAGAILGAIVDENVRKTANFRIEFDRESWSFMEIPIPANLRGICWLFIREQLLGFRAAKRCANLDCRKVMTDAKRNSKEYCSPKCRMHVRRHPDRKDTKVMELG